MSEQQPGTHSVRMQNPYSRSGTIVWASLIMVLLALFILQYTYFMRDNLSRYDDLRPMLEKICVYAHCKIPSKRDLGKLQLLNREIKSHAAVKNALTINLTIMNIASYIQPFPDIELIFSDLQNNLIAKRKFSPDEYLPKSLEPELGMPQDKPFIIQLHIVDPGNHAVNYNFKFH
ncbi:MAG: DUF3426 domain-containing protein [Gammaproteobacteria bacterium]